jgi:hypothetical protein
MFSCVLALFARMIKLLVSRKEDSLEGSASTPQTRASARITTTTMKY